MPLITFPFKLHLKHLCTICIKNQEVHQKMEDCYWIVVHHHILSLTLIHSNHMTAHSSQMSMYWVCKWPTLPRNSVDARNSWDHPTRWKWQQKKGDSERCTASPIIPDEHILRTGSNSLWSLIAIPRQFCNNESKGWNCVPNPKVRSFLLLACYQWMDTKILCHG